MSNEELNNYAVKASIEKSHGDTHVAVIGAGAENACARVKLQEGYPGLVIHGNPVPGNMLRFFEAMTLAFYGERNRQREERRVVPEGYTRDYKGRLVPDALIADKDKVESDLVDEAHQLMAALGAAVDCFRTHVHVEADALVSMRICDAGGSKVAQEPGRVSINNLDNTRRITIDRRATMSFSPEIAAAKELVMDFVDRMGEGANAFIMSLAKKAFMTSDDGEISVSKVNDLLSTPCDEPEWIDIKKSVKAAMRSNGVKTYTRLYHRPDTNAKFTLREVKI